MKSNLERSVKLFRPLDAFVIFAIIFTALLIFITAQNVLSRSDDALVKITADGTEYTYPLNEDKELTLCSNEISINIVISDGSAHIESSNCPDHCCVAMGTINKDGQTVVCVPAKFIMRIISNSEGGEQAPDAIVS